MLIARLITIRLKVMNIRSFFTAAVLGLAFATGTVHAADAKNKSVKYQLTKHNLALSSAAVSAVANLIFKAKNTPSKLVA